MRYQPSISTLEFWVARTPKDGSSAKMAHSRGHTIDPVCLMELPVCSSFLNIRVSTVFDNALRLELFHMLTVPNKVNSLGESFRTLCSCKLPLPLGKVSAPLVQSWDGNMLRSLRMTIPLCKQGTGQSSSLWLSYVVYYGPHPLSRLR